MDNQESVPSRSVTFTKGNKGGQQCHLEGYIYTYEKTSKNGNRQWRCKDMKGFTPTCKGRITTCGELATRSSPHCHPSSDIEVQVQTFLSSVKEDCCTDTTSNVIRKKLLDTPEDVQCFLPRLESTIKELSTGLSQCTNGLLLQINRPFKLGMNRFSLCDL